MKLKWANKDNRAITRLEVLMVVIVVILMIAFLIALLLPALAGAKSGRSLQCMTNQREILIMERMWKDDHGNQKHSEFFLTNDFKTNPGDVELAAIYFRTLLTEGYIKNAAVFICPSDANRRGYSEPGVFMRTNLSYGVKFTSMATNQFQSVLLLERHLQVAGQPMKPGLNLLTANSLLGWSKELHGKEKNSPRGALGYADGHAEIRQARDLDQIFKNQNLATNLLAIP